MLGQTRIHGCKFQSVDYIPRTTWYIYLMVLSLSCPVHQYCRSSVSVAIINETTQCFTLWLGVVPYLRIGTSIPSVGRGFKRRSQVLGWLNVTFNRLDLGKTWYQWIWNSHECVRNSGREGLYRESGLSVAWFSTICRYNDMCPFSIYALSRSKPIKGTYMTSSLIDCYLA